MFKLGNGYSLMILLSLAFSPSLLYATECTTNLDCASMGYTYSASDCNGSDYIIKCPNDTSKMFCRSKTKECDSVGDILYADGTCAANLDELDFNLKIIGVVFDPSSRLALALAPIKANGVEMDIRHTTSTFRTRIGLLSCFLDIPGLTNCSDYETCGTSGKDNTAILAKVDCGISGQENAAVGALNYYPKLCDKLMCRKGQWFIPSAKEAKTLALNKDPINASLSELKSKGFNALLLQEDIWTSTEGRDGENFLIKMGTGYVRTANEANAHEVRPVLKYH